MNLFERIKVVASTKGSVTKLASCLGIAQTTFNGYLNEKRQDNLWPLLPQILEQFPTLSREWLYFEEGPMFKGDPHKESSVHAESLLNERSPLLGDGTAEVERENAQLKELLRTKSELLDAKNDLLAAKDKIIALQEENKRLLESGQNGTFTEHHRDNPRSATKGKPAHTAS